MRSLGFAFDGEPHLAAPPFPSVLNFRFRGSIIRPSAPPSPRDLWETYLPAFEAGINEGGAHSLMSVYNAIDGVPGPANARLPTDILRTLWGFTGAVVGDVDCVHDVHANHHFTRDAAESAARLAVTIQSKAE